jgi:uncharacterized repeat protein (TIGR01451 family)
MTRRTHGSTAATWTGAALILTLLGVPLGGAQAVGTPAGTDISNTATASYTIGGTPVTQTSNTEVITVLELIDVVVTSQDAGAVSVSSPEVGAVLTFLVTNIGNGTEDFALSAQNSVADDFDPSSISIYLDTDGTPGLDTATDTLYSAPSDVRLDANLVGGDRLTVFLVSDIPGSLTDGDFSDVDLVAVSDNHPGGSPSPGTVLPGVGDGGVDAVLGTSSGDGSGTGQYLVANATVSVVKSVASVSDPFGGSQPVPGATITYEIAISLVGGATATAVTITDPIPLNTTYVPASMTLDDGAGGGPVGLSDTLDGDAGELVAGSPPVVTVRLGDLPPASPDQTITFSVTID